MGKVFMFVLPSGSRTRDIVRTTHSFRPFCTDYIECTEVRIDKTFAEGFEWYGYIFDNEWIDEKLGKALPVFFEYSFDYIVLFKKVIDRGELREFMSPRFFKSHVNLIENGLIPVNPDELKHEKALDGWVLENARL